MIGKYTEGHSVSLLTPVLILGMPIFDTLFVMYIRFLRGLPVFLGSPDHMAIRCVIGAFGDAGRGDQLFGSRAAGVALGSRHDGSPTACCDFERSDDAVSGCGRGGVDSP